MKRFILIVVLITMSGFVEANLNNNIIPSISRAAAGSSNAFFDFNFSDNYVLRVKGPIELELLRESRSSKSYRLSFYDDNSSKQVRYINVKGISGKVFWGREDQSYSSELSSFAQASVGASFENAPSRAGACQRLGEYENTYIHSKKTIQENISSCSQASVVACMGPILTVCNAKMDCRDHSDFGTGMKEVTCLGRSDGKCPEDILKCASDTSILDGIIENIRNDGFEVNETDSRQI